MVHPDLLVVLAGEEMTTVSKHDLTALLDRQALVSHELFVEDVHQADRVAEADYQVQA